LISLSCIYNQLTSLHVNGATALTSLYCYSNQLTSLHVNGATALTSLYCYSNQLTSLDVSRNTALTSLSCYSNQLTSLDLSHNNALRSLNCSNNQLTSLNVRNENNSIIYSFDATNNPSLTCIEIDNETDANAGLSPYNRWQKDPTASYSENCYYGKTYVPDNNFEQALIDLDIDTDGIINQQILKSDAEGITSLDVSDPENNVNLPNVTAKIADLTGIEAFINLTELNCSKNQLAGLDISHNTSLIKLSCDNNQITSLDISNNTAIDLLWCQHNQINSLDVSSNTQLKHLRCHHNEIPALDLSNNALLYSLACGTNLIENIDVSQNPELQYLACNDLQLSGIDVSSNLLLKTFVCYNSQLTSLNLSNNTKLFELHCQTNQLTSLDLSQNPQLVGLYCQDNLLTFLDLRNGSNTILSSLNASNNSLNCINVDDETADHSSWITDNDVIFSNECSYNTQAGDLVLVPLSQDLLTTVQYESVTESGNTTLETGEVGPEIPDGFAFGDPINYFDIETTASYTGAIQIAIYFGNMTYYQEDALRLLHYETDHWVDVTTMVDFNSSMIYGEVSFLSPFVVVEDIDPPDFEIINAPVDPVALGNPVNVTVAFNDNNLRSATIDWGDEGGMFDGEVIGNTVSWNYIYTVPGVYAVKIQLEDMGGHLVEETYRYIVIYDAMEGFVTGGGWINSPIGASTLYPDAVGKANFGFVSKYKKGSTVPTGNTEFQFKAGDLNFNSYLYDWLVIAGAKAMFKGEGTINGEGNYGFMISAIDEDLNTSGETDKFRIKIWDIADEYIIYDNQIEEEDPLTEIGAGSIVIHSGPKLKSSIIAPVGDDVETFSEIEIYPNPFSITAYIEFQHDKSIELLVNVYDISGKLIENLYDGRIEEGVRYTFEYKPEGVKSGTYFVKFILDNKDVITKTLILTK